MHVFAKRGLYERFQQTQASLGWKRKGELFLLGLSGGRDSVCLLHLLLVSGHRVVAAHLNHHLRGKESDGDEKFVRHLCKNWGVPLVIGSVKVATKAKRYHLSLEEAARIARYRFLEQVAKKKKINTILVAHHQNDQAETVLLKVLQGARHLCGMALKRPLPRLNWEKKIATYEKFQRLFLIRPLLNSPASEIAIYIQQNSLAFREDSSNHDLSYPRNWIRHYLLPSIEKHLNRNVVKTLARLGEMKEI